MDVITSTLHIVRYNQKRYRTIFNIQPKQGLGPNFGRWGSMHYDKSNKTPINNDFPSK